MIHRKSLRNTISVLALIAIACSKGPAGSAPAPVTPFGAAVLAAEKRVEAGDYPGADRILSDFAVKAKGSPDATEIAFWRALYMVDPNNKNTSMADGVKALDIYLNTTSAKNYKSEAMVLKRTAQSVLALRAAQAAPRIAGRDTVFVTREDEIASLKDQLAKANAELERIKKRLADPKR
ncbi:MAG TPA: hypothetical protein VFT21_01635 [Gemmatimonadaceae bacterium]|nr:hypothetical protein [Gemmatimonadaceae bacterium]